MTPPNAPKAPTQTSARVFLHLRPHRVALLCSLALLTLAGQAAAQVPQLPAIPAALPALPAPAAPALPAIDQGVTTPLGSATAAVRDGNVDACAGGAAPAISDLPLPVEMPVTPPNAALAASACVNANATQAAPAAVAAVGRAAQGQLPDSHVTGVHVDAKGGAGPIGALIHWFLHLF
ncbi:MAG TPA: hypothetical protein VM241_08350 [Candidatus Thermoplasmatota archaeon]|nr:hypothetical protein [Candidatus Thermoplasmatota archaeon]